MPGQKHHVEIYKAKDGWRWRVWNAGRIKADGGQGYSKKSTLKRSLNSLINAFQIERYTIEG